MITVSPTELVGVDYGADRIAELAVQARRLVADGRLDDTPIAIRIDEASVTRRMWISSLDPVEFRIERGALEERHRPRHLSEDRAMSALARLQLELGDRRDADFGAPALDSPTSRAHDQAWSVNLHGRVARIGLAVDQPQLRYRFRNRHGFSDNANRIFEQLWSSDDLTWAAITSLSDRAIDAVVTRPVDDGRLR